MSAGTMELVEVEALDFEHDPSCEHFAGCGSEATWYGVKACCRRVDKYLCDEHRQRQRSLTIGRRMSCKDCGHIFEDAVQGVEWHPVREPQDSGRGES